MKYLSIFIFLGIILPFFLISCPNIDPIDEINQISIPLTPTGLDVGNPTPTSLSISWNESGIAESYQLCRDLNPTGLYTSIAYSGTSIFYIDTDLQSDTTYYYKVSATNSYGSSDFSNYQYETTTYPDLSPPPTPTGLTIESPTLSTLDILWNLSDGANNYRLYRYFSFIDSYLQIYSGTDTSYTDTDLSSSVTYFYKVRAENINGSSDYSDMVSGRTLGPLLAPTGLTIESPTLSTLDILWNLSDGANNYRLYRYFSFIDSYLQIYSGTDTSYTDTDLSSGVTYFYKVKAENISDSSDYSDTVSGKTLGPPSAPTGLTVGNSTFDSLSIGWDSSSFADGYKLYKSTDDYFYFEIYDGTDCDFINTNLHGGWIYYYKIAAYNTYGTGIKSTMVSGKTTEGELALSFFYDDIIYKQYMDADCKGFRSISYNGTVLFTEIYDDLNSYIGRDFQLIWIGSGTGTFSGPAVGIKYGFNNEYESIYGSVTVTQYGQVGERIIGTFSAILSNESSIDGSFSVLRSPDN